MKMEWLEFAVANYAYIKVAAFAILALAGIPPMFSIAKEHGWGAAWLLLNIYVVLVWIAARLP
jgi:hypothetical protein